MFYMLNYIFLPIYLYKINPLIKTYGPLNSILEMSLKQIPALLYLTQFNPKCVLALFTAIYHILIRRYILDGLKTKI